MNTTNKIAINKCTVYDIEKITDLLNGQFEALGIDFGRFRGKNVVIKPNLVIKYDSARAATTHPSVIEAAVILLERAGAHITIAESPGGLYSEGTLRSTYKTCGISDVAKHTGCELNYDTGFQTLPAHHGKVSKNFNVINKICDADIIINISKLKTHSFAMMTGAVKNYFGVIPGTQKVEMHARFKIHNSFFSMLNDLCYMICDTKPTINIIDAIIGMEGNGPSGGAPRAIGCILCGENPFALDLACAEIIGVSGHVPMIEDAAERGYCPRDYKLLDVTGDTIEMFHISDYILPQSKSYSRLDLIPNFLKPRPIVVQNICVGCGDCAANCPVKTIIMEEFINSDGQKRRRATIKKSACIRCFCCQELCTYKAVKIKTNTLFKIIR